MIITESDTAFSVSQSHFFPLFVQFRVASVGGALRKTFAAHGALVRLLPSVRPDVLHQHRLQPERLVAEAALERFFTQVLQRIESTNHHCEQLPVEIIKSFSASLTSVM